MNCKKILLTIASILAIFYFQSGVHAQTQATKDDREKKQSNPMPNMTEKQEVKLEIRKGYFPVELQKANEFFPGELRLLIHNTGETDLKSHTPFKVSFGIVQTRVTPKKFIKCLKLEGKSECWVYEGYIDKALKSGESQWQKFSPFQFGLFVKADNRLQIGKELDDNWSFYLNGLPEETKKDMRLGVKIEIEGGLKNLITTTPTGYLYN